MFFGPIKAAVSAVAASGLGAFTPNSASAGALAFSAVPSAVCAHLIRAEEGATWELFYSWWNGTTLSRSTTQFISSSSGSPITFTTAATVAIVPDPQEAMPHLGSGRWGLISGQYGLSAPASYGIALAAVGTAGSINFAATNILTEQNSNQYTSATTANALAGLAAGTLYTSRNTGAGRGGFDFSARFGATVIVTAQRLAVGLSAAVMTTNEPSAIINCALFAKDSGDTNIQFMVNDGSGNATKSDTGIPYAANALYECFIWCPPGGASIAGLIVRIDTGDIWYGSASSNLPASGTGLAAQCQGGLTATTGTAYVQRFCSLFLKSGF